MASVAMLFTLGVFCMKCPYGHSALAGALPGVFLCEPFMEYFKKRGSLVQRPALPPSTSCVKLGFEMEFDLFLIFSFLFCRVVIMPVPGIKQV